MQSTGKSPGDGYILAIETSTTTARVAVLDRAGARRAAREATAERHSSNLLRLCDEVLREAGVVPAALDAIACGAGPGSFTGLRVGLAVGKGLALPTSRPFLLVSSLRGAGAGHPERDEYGAAGRGRAGRRAVHRRRQGANLCRAVSRRQREPGGGGRRGMGAGAKRARYRRCRLRLRCALPAPVRIATPRSSMLRAPATA